MSIVLIRVENNVLPLIEEYVESDTSAAKTVRTSYSKAQSYLGLLS